MSRVKRGVSSHRRHKKVLHLAKGYRGRSSTCFRIALQRVEKALQYAYRDRRNKKRTFRALWIQRINAAVRLYGITYNQFMYGLSRMESDVSLLLNRKVLADMAVNEPDAFRHLVEKAKTQVPLLRQVPTFL